MKNLVGLFWGLFFFIIVNFLSDGLVASQNKNQSQLYKILAQDCQPSQKNRNNGYHRELQTVVDVMLAKRRINDGYLPLSHVAKESIFDYLVSQFYNQQKAKDALQDIATQNKLHPLSVAKIDEKIDAYYTPRLSIEEDQDSLFDYCQSLGDSMNKSAFRGRLLSRDNVVDLSYDLNNQDFEG
jgi:hypothetical protein